uniref:Cytochrome b6-f complex subunit 7 n=1 Tax=Kuetzingia canaliculata TaxID=228262 RepID=A0A1Z1MPN5_KUECA|nr:cytochrome b6-f complex subunit 7 [Kuetzingia canaliculata]ARW67896.1 cytochrome b6-f complex subunit 7 [Kuetzingia canaliculata]
MESEIFIAALVSPTIIIIGLLLGFVLLKVQGE